MKLSSFTTIFLILGLLFAFMTITSSRASLCFEKGRDGGATVKPEGVVFDLARVSTFTPPTPNANH
ncbi:hypothetical protein BHE74_00033075 [Ensete ventricosum]|nr:hypothetical protein BHE74_00033075 [Ensete ventricosum]